MNKISVVIVTRNSELYLRRVLECVVGFDELLIVDMGSTDSTLSIAKEFDCRIEHVHPLGKITIEDARNIAMQQAHYPWVFMVEPNELVSRGLVDYIKNFVVKEEGDGLFVPRKNYLMYRFRRGGYPDYRPRLFRRSVTSWDAIAGTFPLVEGKMVTIPAAREDLALVHLSTRFERGMTRHGRRDLAFDKKHSRKERVSLAEMLLGPTWTFIQLYFLKGTMFYGKDGFVFACRNSCDHFASLYDVHQRHRRAQFNAEHRDEGFQLP